MALWIAISILATTVVKQIESDEHFFNLSIHNISWLPAYLYSYVAS